MRLPLIVLPALLFAAPVMAEPLKVAKGMWSTSTDIYLTVAADGEPLDMPPEHSTLDECWSADEDVIIDESMASLFEGCVSAGSWGKAHSFDMELACEFDGIPMTGTAQFAVNKSGNQFSGRLFLSGGSDGLLLEAEGLLLGYRTGTCAAP